MKITRDELRRMLAEIDGDNVVPVMCDNGELSHYEVINTETGDSLGEYTPDTDANQAIQLLMAWQNCASRCMTIERWGGEDYHVELMDRVDLMDETVSYITDPNLNHAICLAVLEAETKTKYTLED